MRIILVGCGVVGRSFLSLLLKNKDYFVHSYGFNPRVVAIVDRDGAILHSRGLDLSRVLKVKEERRTVSADPEYGRPNLSALEVIRDVEADVLVEVTPTNVKTGEPAMSHIKEALKNKKHVVTTNKSIALALPALLELAAYNGVQLKFSGTVGAGMPVLDLARRLSGDRIISMRGVLNGTTNYILTAMEEKRMPFDEALKEAQKLGFAEADPSMDVDGIDTAVKLVILANSVMKRSVTLEDVSISGIRGVRLEDVMEASEKGFSIKLVGSVNKELVVKVNEVPKDDPLCVKGVLNAVTFSLEVAGDITISGKGAGGLETGSSIIRDLLEIRQAGLRA
jgi:homoserine dehydrogenase